MIKVIRCYADMSKEYLYDKAIEEGLSEDAANNFKYFYEVPLDVTVEIETGDVLKAVVPGVLGGTHYGITP
jgi:hypothetical protein